jgi:hypothetical protein
MAFIHPVYLHRSGSVYEYSFFEANPYFIGSGLDRNVAALDEARFA